MVTRALALSVLSALAGCKPAEADQRFEKGATPATATFASGVTLWASPARVRVDGALTVVRAAAPVLDIDLVASAPTQVSFAVDNVMTASRIDPTPDSLRVIDATEVELGFNLEPGTTRVHLSPGGSGPARFAVISDVHNNLATFGEFTAAVRQWRPDMVLCMGDLTQSGQSGQFDELFGMLRDAGVPFYTTLGNHELMGAAVDRYEEKVGPSSVAFLLRGVQVIFVDSSGSVVAPEAYAWLAQQLSGRPKGSPALVLTHIPPLEPWGTRDHAFSVRDDAEHFLQVLADHQATHLFVGHVHSYAEYTLRGIPVTLSGGGGGPIETDGGVGHHWLKVEVDPVAGVPVTVTRVDLSAE